MTVKIRLPLDPLELFLLLVTAIGWPAFAVCFWFWGPM